MPAVAGPELEAPEAMSAICVFDIISLLDKDLNVAKVSET